MKKWFGGKADVDELVARGKFGRAIEELEERLRREPDSTTHRQRLGDILGRAGRVDDAVGVLRPLADAFVREGSSAKAIAVVKKIERLDPESDVSALLAKVRDVADPPRKAPRAQAEAPTMLALSSLPAHLESDSVEIAPFRDLKDRPTATSDIDAGWSERLKAEQGTFGWSPLLEGLPAEVFTKVVGRLKLLIKNPGAIICGEGERAASLFVLARGFARVYRRSRDGRQRQIMVLEEGRFFGEEVLLENDARRPITVTAASECELLEIDLEELSVILSVHSKARERLERAYSQRIWRR